MTENFRSLESLKCIGDVVDSRKYTHRPPVDVLNESGPKNQEKRSTLLKYFKIKSIDYSTKKCCACVVFETRHDLFFRFFEFGNVPLSWPSPKHAAARNPENGMKSEHF